VRRYNFFNWSKTLPIEVQMMQNPNVSVRYRGVMEKCSFCVQRIRRTQLRAQLEDRNVQEGEVGTACQQACPAQALTFGDLNNPASAVSKAKENSRRYEMLAELDVKPRVSYLGRVRNPNPRLVQETATPEA
jgi:molybdopterin-containing oxidoreductase family iron-sulfur binding subunit